MAEMLEKRGSQMRFTGITRPASEIEAELRSKGFWFHERSHMLKNMKYPHEKWDKYAWLIEFKNKHGESSYFAATEEEETNVGA